MADQTRSSREVIHEVIDGYFHDGEPRWMDAEDLAERIDRALFGEEQAWAHIALEPVDQAALERMKELWRMRHAGEPDFEFREGESADPADETLVALAELKAEVRRLPLMQLVLADGALVGIRTESAVLQPLDYPRIAALLREDRP